MIHVQTVDILQGHVPILDSVDDHTVQLGHLELEKIDDHKRQHTQKQGGQMLEVVAVDVLTKQHSFTSFPKKTPQNAADYASSFIISHCFKFIKRVAQNYSDDFWNPWLFHP
jgi:hypothetical protein